MQTRYYDAEVGRFLNADNIAYLDPETINGCNLYAYCLNNPVMFVDPSGHFLISALIIGGIIGAAVGFGVAAYIDYSDDGSLFNGSVAWYDYLGASVLGGLVGVGLGAFSTLSFTMNIPTGLAVLQTTTGATMVVATGAVAVTVTGADVLIALGLIIAMGKGFGPRPGHNQYENKMWDEALRRLDIKNKDLARRLHNRIRKYPYQDNLKDLIKLLQKILAEWGL